MAEVMIPKYVWPITNGIQAVTYEWVHKDIANYNVLQEITHMKVNGFPTWGGIIAKSLRMLKVLMCFSIVHRKRDK